MLWTSSTLKAVAWKGIYSVSVPRFWCTVRSLGELLEVQSLFKAYREGIFFMEVCSEAWSKVSMPLQTNGCPVFLELLTFRVLGFFWKHSDISNSEYYLVLLSKNLDLEIRTDLLPGNVRLYHWNPDLSEFLYFSSFVQKHAFDLHSCRLKNAERQSSL